MTKFNPQQQLAIDALNTNIIVSASAGAGKTTVLIARLMKRILQDKVHIQTVCALTFTEAAAQEMKTRLLAELNKEKLINSSRFLDEQIALVETAQITTIHSFCLNLIKNHAHVIGMNPARTENILDDAEVKLMKEAAFNAVYNDWLERDFDKTFKMVDYFSSQPLNSSAFKDAIYDAASWMRSRKDLNKSLLELKSVYLAQSINDWPIQYQNYFYEEHFQKLKEIEENLEKVITIVSEEANEKTKPAENLPVLIRKLSEIRSLLQLIENRDMSFYEQLPNALDFKMPAVRGSERFKDAKAPLEKILNETINYYDTFENQFERMNELYPLLLDIIAFSTEFLDKYQSLKITENVLDFDDFETYALEILSKNNFAVSQLLKDHYQEIMVDEFQDTNEVQDEIIRLISNGKNLFRVGDIKQSIYRFRGAKPNIMRNLMNDEAHQNLYLSFNYRSKEPIVTFNNHVFDRLMNHTYYSEYTEHDHVDCGLESQKVDGPKVELHLFERDTDSVYYLRSDEQKALHISQEIIKHEKEGFQFRDMTVLVRSHAQKKYLKKVFEEQGIPHYINEPIGFYNSEIVQDIINILNYIVYRNDYYLAKLLNSKFYNLNLNDLAKIKLVNKADSLHDNLQAYNFNLYTQLNLQVTEWAKQDIVTVLQDIFTVNNAYNETLSIKDKTNCDFLLDKAIQFQENNVPKVQQFIEFVQALDDQRSSEASHLSAEDNVVEVMTVHQSKGLQFPLTFFWGSGPLNLMDHRDTIIFDDELGIGLNNIWSKYRVNYKTLIRSSIEYKQKNEELEEVLRLLYVALTRAQTKLIVVDVANEFKKHDMSTSLLFNYRRQVELLLASAPAHVTEIYVNDASTIEAEKLATTSHDEKSFDQPLLIEFDTIEAFSLFDDEELNFDKKYAMAYGTSLHEAIESMPHELWDDKDLVKTDPKVRPALKAYNQHAFTQVLYSFDTIYHEMPFLLRDNGENVSGIIDFLAINQDKVIIVDFKSDNTDESTLIARYQNQIDRYKKVIKKEFKDHQLESYLYSFFHNKYIKI